MEVSKCVHIHISFQTFIYNNSDIGDRVAQCEENRHVLACYEKNKRAIKSKLKVEEKSPMKFCLSFDYTSVSPMYNLLTVVASWRQVMESLSMWDFR